MGSSIGGAAMVLAGVRVSFQPNFTPAYTVGNKRNSEMLKFSVVKNSNKGTDARTGDKGRKDTFPLVAFGELANRLAKALAPGTEFSCMTRPQSFIGKACGKDGVQFLSRDGQPAEVTKINFVITEMWGIVGHSEKQIERETLGTEGSLFHWRPRDWNQNGTNGPNLWAQLKAQRNAYKWDGRSPENGYAKVNFNLPPGAVIDLSSPAQRRGNTGGFPQQVAQVANAPQVPAQPQANTPMFVSNPVPAPAPVANTPQFQVNTGQAPAPAPQWANQGQLYPAGQVTNM